MGIRSNLYATFDFEIVDEFLDHYSMMVESMEVMIIDLSKPEMQRRCVDELFRVFHNIKSASGFLKINPMYRLANLVEDELSALRNSDKKINEETINWLLTVSDMFAAWETNLKLDEDLNKVPFSLLKIPDTDN